MNSSHPVLNQYEISTPESLCKQPLVSVLMITYNHESFVSEAVNGVIEQACDFDFELIIGEDCSSDETLSVIKKLQKKYPGIIRIITANKNVGFAENLRRIIDVARGQFTDFCEGDDYWIDNQKLADEVKLFNSNSNIAIVHGDHVFRYDFWGKQFIVEPQGRYANILDKSLLGGDIISRVFSLKELITHTSTVSYKTIYLKEYLQGEESKFVGAFYDACVASYCATKGTAAYINRPVSAYRVWEGSMMRSGTAGMLRHNFEIFNYFLLFLIKHPDVSYLMPQPLLYDYAQQLYYRALLNHSEEYRHFLGEYLAENYSGSKKMNFKAFLYGCWITKLLYQQFKFWQRLYVKNLYRAKIYFNFKERIEIKN